jgi:hypothetical protein
MSLTEVEEAMSSYGVIVVGPLQHGATSSDSVAAITAEQLCAEALVIIKAWRLDDRVPAEGSVGNLRQVRLEDVIDVVAAKIERAGRRPILDMACLRVLQRARFRTFVVAFDDAKALLRLPDPSAFDGIEIVSNAQREYEGMARRLAETVPTLLERARASLGGLRDVVHDIGHVRRCVSNAMELCTEYPYSRRAAVELAAWWHDVGRLDGSAGHEARGAQILATELRQRGVGEDMVSDLIDAIAFHKWSMLPATLEGKIIRDADKLDAVCLERWIVWDKAVCDGANVAESELEAVCRVAQDLDRIIALKALLPVLRERRAELSDGVRLLRSSVVSKYARLAGLR